MGGSLGEPGHPFYALITPGGQDEGREGRGQGKRYFDDSSLTARLMTQHTKAWSSAAF